MSIKDLFNKIPESHVSAVSSSSDVESYDYVLAKTKKQREFVPRLDFSTASNFAVYGSAKEYYKSAIERIYNFYPYDGSKKEKIEFSLSSSYLDEWILNNKYPKTTGYINFSYGGWGSLSTKTNGYGLPTSEEYIYSRGGLHTASSGMEGVPLYKTFDKSVKYDATLNRTTNFRMNTPDGITVEFWLKKEEFDISKTEKEVVLDLWNGETSSSSDYGRLTIALTSSAQADGSETFLVTLQSGTVGFFEQTIGNSSITTGSLANWHHYALSFSSASSGINTRIYVDGVLNENQTLGSVGMEEVGGLVNAYIGALQTSPSSSNGALAQNELKYAGKFSGSLDEFRYWKTLRTSKQIVDNWNRAIGSGTNTDESNVNLGVYYKFNEGVVGGTSVDSIVLDYSGRIANGNWTGYSSGARSTTSAIEEQNPLVIEEKDPIIYSSHPEVVSLLQEMEVSGSDYDNDNGNMLINKIPSWLVEEDQENNNHLKYLTQIISSYLDKLNAQISQVKNNKFKEYSEGTIKPLTFADRLLQERGLVTTELLINSEILEYFENRNKEGKIFENEIFDIKNMIYQNIYNNLNYIFKSKGTEESFRNLIRCFGIDDEILKINRYTDKGTHYFTDKVKHTSIYKKFITHNKQDSSYSTIFQTSSAQNSLTFISGSSSDKKEKNSAFTFEINLIAPLKPKSHELGYINFPHFSSSIAGFHQAKEDESDYAWNSSNIANLQMYLVRDTTDSDGGYFQLRNYDGTISLTSSFFKQVYNDNSWTIAARLKPSTYPYSGISGTPEEPTYILEFYGVHHRGDTLVDSFLVTSSLSYAIGSSYLCERKRVYTGAHWQDFNNSLLTYSDLSIGTCRFYLDYLEDEVLNQHNKDIKNYGSNKTFEGSSLINTDLNNKKISSSDLLILNWDFETVTGSDSSGEFIVEDISSGSTNAVFGYLDNIVKAEHRGKGHGFTASTNSFVLNNFTYAAKKELPEISYTADDIKIKDDVIERFIEDEDVSDNLYAFEKGMYQVISEEMLNSMSSVTEMNNLIGKVVDRYRFNYKNLDYMRRIFFDKVEEDPDLDKFTEYFKWIDRSIYVFLEQLIPISSRFSSKISDVVESHIFERSKVRSLIPNKFVDPTPNDHVNSIRELRYNWKFGHAPISGGENDNCLWQRERKERTDIAARETIRKVVENDNNQSGNTLADKSGVTYQGSTYALRKLSRVYKESVSMVKTLHGGINYEIQKNRRISKNAIEPHSKLSPSGIPLNVILVGAGPGQGVELKRECNDVENPNLKKKFDVRTILGKFAGGTAGGSFTPIDDTAHFSFGLKGSFSLPFNIFSGSIKSGYNKRFEEGWKEGAYITNVHSDTANHRNDVPLQGPFTERWVGGHQSRHQDINRYDINLIDGETLSAPPNNLHNIYTRPEAHRLLLIDGGFGDGAIGLVDAQYGVTNISGHPNNGKYPDVAKKKATYFREETAKRPINIKNIQTTTSSYSHGNYREQYEIISVASGKQHNNPLFRSIVDVHPYLPSAIADVLPQTTNYHTLIGVSDHPSGNVFGVGESNILNNEIEVFESGTIANFSFDLNIVSSINHESNLQLTGGATTYLVETRNPNSTTTKSTIPDKILYTGSAGLAIKNSDNNNLLFSTGINSDLGTSNYSVSFWLWHGDSNNNQMIYFSDGTTRHQIEFDNHLRVTYENDSGTSDFANFLTYISSDTNEWNHYVVHFDIDDLSTGVPRLWKNGIEINGSGYIAIGGTTPNINRTFVSLDDGMGYSDVIIWDKLLTQEDIDILYAKGNWMNPQTHPSASNIIDWYKFGYEDYWGTAGYVSGDNLNTYGGNTQRVSSSFGTGNNTLTTTVASRGEFTAGLNPFGSTKSNSTFWNELSSSLSSSFTDFTVSYTGAGPATFNLVADSKYDITMVASEDGSDFSNVSSTNGVSVVLEKGYINTTSIATGSVQKSVISTRFSAPGSIETMTYGFLDAYNQELSAYNALPYRNLLVRGSGSGESGTIRLNDHLGNRHGLITHLSRHSGKFGADSVYGSVTSGDYVTKPSFHKIHRNTARKIVSDSTLANPTFNLDHDNFFISSTIPRSDFQYSWITSSLGDNYSITSGKQRMFGYAPRDGIISSSYEVHGDSGYVAAITFPTASELFGE